MFPTDRLRGSVPRPLTLRYYLFVIASTESFVNPILTLFMLDRGLTFTQIGIVNGIWWTAWIASEVPTGYLGDRFGRKTSLLAGSSLKVVAIVGFGFSTSFEQILTFQALWAVSVTLRTGALSSWLYDMLQQQYDTEEFTRIRGRGSTLGLLLGTVGAVLGGELSEIGFTLPFLLAAGVTAVGVPVVWSFPNATVDVDPPSVREATALLRAEFASPPLRSFVLYTGLFSGVAYMVYNLLIQPISVDVGLTKGTLGWFYGLLTLASAVGSYSSDWLKERVGLRRGVLAAPLILSATLVLPVVIPSFALVSFILLQFSVRVVRIFRQQYINDHVGTAGRTTVLSAASMIFGLIALPLEVGFGPISQFLGRLPALAVAGGLVGVCSVGLILLEPPVSLDALSGGGQTPTGDNETT